MHERFSRDLSTQTPSRPWRCGLAAGIVGVLLATPAVADDLAPRVLVLSLPKCVGLLLLAGFLAGLAVGIFLAVQLLRAADTAAMQYHRAEVAAILDASSATHQIVEEIVANAHTRIALLRMDLEDLEEAQR